MIMSSRLFVLMAAAVVAFTGCSKSPSNPSDGGTKELTAALTGAKHFARVLPKETAFYVRLRGVETLKDRIILPGFLNNSADLQKQIDAVYGSILDAMG